MGATKEGQRPGINALREKYSPKQQQEFQKRGADIQAKQDQLKKTSRTHSAKKRWPAPKPKLPRLQTALQRDTDDAATDSEADSQKMMQDIGPKLVNAVTKYSQDNQIMIVFDLSSQPNNLVCCASAPDITREVVALYDKMNPVGGAAWPAPAATVKPTTPPASRFSATPDSSGQDRWPRRQSKIIFITAKGRSACFAPFYFDVTRYWLCKVAQAVSPAISGLYFDATPLCSRKMMMSPKPFLR